MSKASDRALVRTTAHQMAWTIEALEALSEQGILTESEVDAVHEVARKVIQAAKADPTFLGSKATTRILEWDA
jgi:hypothetical protein